MGAGPASHVEVRRIRAIDDSHQLGDTWRWATATETRRAHGARLCRCARFSCPGCLSRVSCAFHLTTFPREQARKVCDQENGHYCRASPIACGHLGTCDNFHGALGLIGHLSGAQGLRSRHARLHRQSSGGRDDLTAKHIPIMVKALGSKPSKRWNNGVGRGTRSALAAGAAAGRARCRRRTAALARAALRSPPAPRLRQLL
jgi:hypothetical protein